MKDSNSYKGQRALVVDDSQSMRTQLSMLLKDCKFTVVEAVNGIEALTLLRKEKFNVVFSDLVMPELDGFELCEEVRKLPNGGSVPMVVVSTYSDSHYITKALRLGADDFLVKPIAPDRLQRVLARVTLPILDEV